MMKLTHLCAMILGFVTIKIHYVAMSGIGQAVTYNGNVSAIIRLPREGGGGQWDPIIECVLEQENIIK